MESRSTPKFVTPLQLFLAGEGKVPELGRHENLTQDLQTLSSSYVLWYYILLFGVDFPRPSLAQLQASGRSSFEQRLSKFLNHGTSQLLSYLSITNDVPSSCPTACSKIIWMSLPVLNGCCENEDTRWGCGGVGLLQTRFT